MCPSRTGAGPSFQENDTSPPRVTTAPGNIPMALGQTGDAPECSGDDFHTTQGSRVTSADLDGLQEEEEDVAPPADPAVAVDPVVAPADPGQTSSQSGTEQSRGINDAVNAVLVASKNALNATLEQLKSEALVDLDLQASLSSPAFMNAAGVTAETVVASWHSWNGRRLHVHTYTSVVEQRGTFMSNAVGYIDFNGSLAHHLQRFIVEAITVAAWRFEEGIITALAQFKEHAKLVPGLAEVVKEEMRFVTRVFLVLKRQHAASFHELESQAIYNAIRAIVAAHMVPCYVAAAQATAGTGKLERMQQEFAQAFNGCKQRLVGAVAGMMREEALRLALMPTADTLKSLAEEVGEEIEVRVFLP